MEINSIATLNKKIWNMAGVLMDDGVSNSDYLEQLTYLLFLKMSDELSKPPYNKKIPIPEDCRWEELKNCNGEDLEIKYKYILNTLAQSEGILKEIYSESQCKITKPSLLSKVIAMIDRENWNSMSSDVKGDIYEGLLQKIAEDTKSGAGQYFTPRPVINTMVKCLKPKPDKTIVDPCCGSGGFLLSAKKYIEEHYNLNKEQKENLKFNTFRGWEIVQNTYRLCLMNLFLHNISDFEGKPPITRNDSLSADPGERFDYVLTNPPFGRKSSITFTTEDGDQEDEERIYNRQDFWVTSSNKQINFVQHIHTILKNNGKAAVVVPDNVLFEEGAAQTVRKKLLENTNFHTILRLPTGIFYKPGVKANVIFFDNKMASPKIETREIWIYDFRSNVHFTLKQNPLKESDLEDFVQCFNSNNILDRKETYSENNPNGRWRKFSYEEIKEKYNYNLDITWMKSNDIDIEELELEDILKKIKTESEQMNSMVKELEKIINEVQ